MITSKEICQAMDKIKNVKLKVVKVESHDSKTEEWDTSKNMYMQLVRIKSYNWKKFHKRIRLNCMTGIKLQKVNSENSGVKLN